MGQRKLLKFYVPKYITRKNLEIYKKQLEIKIAAAIASEDTTKQTPSPFTHLFLVDSLQLVTSFYIFLAATSPLPFSSTLHTVHYCRVAFRHIYFDSHVSAASPKKNIPFQINIYSGI